jgi:hypothetical protein
LEKIYSRDFFLIIKNYNLPIPRPPLRTSKLQKKPFSQKRTSSTSKHEISYFFLLLWVIFSLLDPDPDSGYGSGSTDLIESGSEALLSWHDLIDMFVQSLEKKFGLEPGIIPEEEMPPEPAVCYSVN